MVFKRMKIPTSFAELHQLFDKLKKENTMACKCKKQVLSVEEMDRLVDLISWGVNGTEQGVIDYVGWRNKCRELKTFLVERGYRPHGEWTT